MNKPLNVDHLRSTADLHPPDSQPVQGLYRSIEITQVGLLISYIPEPGGKA